MAPPPNASHHQGVMRQLFMGVIIFYCRMECGPSVRSSSKHTFSHRSREYRFVSPSRVLAICVIVCLMSLLLLPIRVGARKNCGNNSRNEKLKNRFLLQRLFSWIFDDSFVSLISCSWWLATASSDEPSIYSNLYSQWTKRAAAMCTSTMARLNEKRGKISGNFSHFQLAQRISLWWVMMVMMAVMMLLEGFPRDQLGDLWMQIAHLFLGQDWVELGELPGGISIIDSTSRYC